MTQRDATQIGLLEVARREQGAVEVALFWNSDASTATIVVWNWNSGVCLRLHAEPAQAKYAYTHPFAYAAAQGVPQRELLEAA